MAPLQLLGTPVSSDFMGLRWSNFIEVDNVISSFPNNRGVYRVKSLESDVLLYIGESINIRNRIRSHFRKDWGQKIGISYCILEDAKSYHLKETEKNLIGGYYSIQQNVPRFQFRNLQ
ncbi:GIY-YIG nuclease family protein [Ectobacillus sp. sgz5001026]|uniref:GIY-YIG nuclease family protein n=1 Tax=Ectobacillus sp. sgz5001026 TaxID=3242473 RepID=UPI0036D2A5C5